MIYQKKKVLPIKKKKFLTKFSIKKKFSLLKKFSNEIIWSSLLKKFLKEFSIKNSQWIFYQKQNSSLLKKKNSKRNSLSTKNLPY
jgi:hypothetical protein